MAQRGARVTGIDLSDKALSVAQLHLLESRLQVRYGKGRGRGLRRAHAGEFDAVTCMNLLEHVPQPASMVAACARLVRPGGRYFSRPSTAIPRPTCSPWIGAEYVLKLLPKGTHDYLRFVKPSELARWSRDSGLRPDELIGMTYSPISRRYRLGRDCDVNYLLRCLRDA